MQRIEVVCPKCTSRSRKFLIEKNSDILEIWRHHLCGVIVLAFLHYCNKDHPIY